MAISREDFVVPVLMSLKTLLVKSLLELPTIEGGGNHPLAMRAKQTPHEVCEGRMSCDVQNSTLHTGIGFIYSMKEINGGKD